MAAQPLRQLFRIVAGSLDAAQSKRLGLASIRGSRRQAAVVDLQLEVRRVHEDGVEAAGSHDFREPVGPGRA